MQEPIQPKYHTSYENNQFSYNRDRLITLLGNFYNYPNRLKETLELGYEYSRKQPQTLPELVYTIREYLLFDTEDYRYNYKRQEILIDLIIDNSNVRDSIYEVTFPSIAATFLQYKYHHTKGGRNYSFIFYDYPFPLNEATKKIRAKIWEKIDKDFSKNVMEYFQILSEYSKRTPDVEIEVMIFDVKFVLSIINNHLTYENFEYCYYVQEQIRWWNKNGIQNVEFDVLKSKFVNKIYETYLKVYWDRLRDKESYEFENQEEYEKLKEAEVRESFVFNTINEFEEFYGQYEYLLNWEDNKYWMTRAFDIVIDENVKKSIELGFDIIKYIIKKNNSIQYTPNLPFKGLLHKQDNAEELWKIISSDKYEQSNYWQIRYFYFLDDDLVGSKECINLITTINDISSNTSLYFSNFTKFLKFNDTLLSKLLKIIVDKQRNDKIFISIPHNFLSENINYLKNDLTLIKQLYLQEDMRNSHFDYDGKEFLEVLRLDNNFLFEFVKHIYAKEGRLRSYEHRILSVVWLIDSIEDLLIDVFDFIAEKETYLGILEHFCNAFFYEIKREENKIKSDRFIINYIDKNFKDKTKMNMIADVLRHTKKDLFEEAYLYYLKLNQDVELYEKIYWLETGGSTTGDESLGERMAMNWRRILEITNKLDLGIKLIPIKKYINDRIEFAWNYAEDEKRRRFIERF